MIINEEGTYNLVYTATDECGNETVVNRELEVIDNSPRRTVLYTDGTFIINEKQTDEAHNIELHGAATNVYIPFDPNGATNTNKYIFDIPSSRPWNSVDSTVRRVEIGSAIKPTSLRHWFNTFENTTVFDLEKLDTSDVTNMSSAFYQCASIVNLDLSGFDTSNVKNMQEMFSDCTALTSAIVDSFDTSSVTNMYKMFYHCSALLSLDLSSFNTPSLSNAQNMFEGCTSLASLDVSNFNVLGLTSITGMFRACSSLTELDLSSFDTRNIDSMAYMFAYCTLLKTIYVSSNFVVDQVTGSSNMFTSDTNLVGGAGTTFNSSYIDKTRAKIDGGTSSPGYFTARP